MPKPKLELSHALTDPRRCSWIDYLLSVCLVIIRDMIEDKSNDSQEPLIALVQNVGYFQTIDMEKTLREADAMYKQVQEIIRKPSRKTPSVI